MPSNKDKKGLAIFLVVLVCIICLTYGITTYARGYKISLNKGISLKATGLVSATSKPKSASVFIDDHLITATDDTINLSPGQYDIKIVKDGYIPWVKKIDIKKETVFQTDTYLFRSIPDTKLITPSGAINPISTPDGTKIYFAVASSSASKDNGLYQFDLIGNRLPTNKLIAKKIAPNFPNIDWSKFTYLISPNGKQLLATSQINKTSFLINLEESITQNTIKDISVRLDLVQLDWKKQEEELISNSLNKLPISFQSFVSTQSASHIQINSDEKMILYLSNNDFILENNIISPPPSQSTQIQTRQIKKDNWYVYDIKDDTNFIIGPKNDIINPSWLMGSNSIIFIESKSIKLVEYDSTNKQTLFSDKFIGNNIFPTPDGNQVIILSNIYSNNNSESLYSLTIR